MAVQSIAYIGTVRKWSQGDLPHETDLDQRAGHTEDLRNGSELERLDSANGWT